MLVYIRKPTCSPVSAMLLTSFPGLLVIVQKPTFAMVIMITTIIIIVNIIMIMVIVIVLMIMMGSLIAGEGLTEPVPTIRATQIQSKSAW